MQDSASYQSWPHQTSKASYEDTIKYLVLLDPAPAVAHKMASPSETLHCTTRTSPLSETLNCTTRCSPLSETLHCTTRCSPLSETLNCTTRTSPPSETLHCTTRYSIEYSLAVFFCQRQRPFFSKFFLPTLFLLNELHLFLTIQRQLTLINKSVFLSTIYIFF